MALWDYFGGIFKSVRDQSDFITKTPPGSAVAGKMNGRRPDDLTPNLTYQRVAPVRNAITKISSYAARAKVRFFNDNDDEIVGGSLVDIFNRPNKRQGIYQFTEELISWYLLTSEFAVQPIATNVLQKPTGLIPLDPTRLYISSPINPKAIDDVLFWRYNQLNGIQEVIPSEMLVYAKSFSPGHVRGISSIVSGTNEINTYYQAVRFTRTFFENDTRPSLHVKLPPTMGAEQKDQFVEEYCNTFNIRMDGGHKSFFSDAGVEIDPIESNLKNSFATDLIAMELSAIYQLYSCPPMISGDWANAKYDSAAEQLQVFADSTIFPILKALTDTFQMQIVDRYAPFWRQDMQIAKSTKLSRNVRKALQVSKANNPGTGIYIVWDVDTLPMAAKIQQSKIDAAITLMNEGRVSKRDAFEFYDIDIPDSDSVADDAIMISTKLIEYQSPETIAQQRASEAAANAAALAVTAPAANNPTPAEPADDTQPDDQAQKSQAQELTAEDKTYAKRVSRFMNEYRVLALKNQSMKLRDVDILLREICPDDEILKTESRRIFAQIKEVSAEDRISAIRSIFNSIPKQRIRDISRQHNIGVTQ